MHEVSSLSLFVGTGECNAHCPHCAGAPLRKFAPQRDGDIDRVLVYDTLRSCYEKGARYLSLRSSGEPTLSPISMSYVLQIVRDFQVRGMKFEPVNLYTNGIRIGEDLVFCQTYLMLWKSLGLTTVYVTVHDSDEKLNAKAYGVDRYPALSTVFHRIHAAGLTSRANIVLSKRTVSTFDKFVKLVETLRSYNVGSISVWPVRGMDDKPDTEQALEKKELDSITDFCRSNRVRLLLETDKVAYTTGQKLTLFPNGVLSNSWCN